VKLAPVREVTSERGTLGMLIKEKGCARPDRKDYGEKKTKA